MTKATLSLPENYKKATSIDIEKDKKTALIVNGISLAVFLVMAIIMHIFVPAHQLVLPQADEGHFAAIPRIAVLFVSLFAYIILHELTHGITMKLFGASKVNYGFTGLYAYAGSDGYFDKKSFIIISLCPIVLWGVILAIINLIVPYNWIWTIYFIQIMNVAGAAGDFYVIYKLIRSPKDVLVYDEGVGMTIYSCEAEASSNEDSAQSAIEVTERSEENTEN